MEVLGMYTPLLGGVPLEMLLYHVNHHENMLNEEKVEMEDISEALTELLREKKISRDVIAFRIVG